MTQSDADKSAKLPRGPHALPQDVVIAHQRDRLLDAVTVEIAQRGYAELTVRVLIDRAGVSRRTFYQIFDDKIDCVFAAHERAFSQLSRTIVDACRSGGSWSEGVAAAVEAGVGFAVSLPNEAQLVVVACHTASEPKLASRGHAAHEKLADLLRAGRNRPEVQQTPPELTEQAVIGAAMAVVGARLLAGDSEGLRTLAPELTEIILTPYLGDQQAHRIAQAQATTRLSEPA